MEVFGILLLGLLVVCILSLLAAANKTDSEIRYDNEHESNDLHLVHKCNELRKLAARARKEISHG